MAKSLTTVNKSFDWVLFSIYLALVAIGLMMLYATGADFNKEEVYFWNSDVGRQVIWAGASILFCIAVSLIDWKFWDALAYPVYILGILLLLLLLGFGTEIKGAKSWFIVAGFSLQPSELVKVSTIIGLSAFCTSFKTNVRSFIDQLYSFGLLIVPVFLVLLQPDAGSALTFLAISLILFRSGLHLRYFLVGFALLLATILSIIFSPYLAFSVILTLSLFFILDFSKSNLLSYLILLAFIVSIFAGERFDFTKVATALHVLVTLMLIQLNAQKSFWKAQYGSIAIIALIGITSFAISHTYQNILKPHQRDRINVWLKPGESDPRGSLYNLTQSKLAIGSGGLNGKGFLQGTMTKLNYVPAQNTDFIFSTIGEEQGFLGCLGTIFLFFALILRILSIGENSESLFTLYFSYGAAGLIFTHVFINIGMTIGIAPVIGIPLPFISKGGSSLLAFSIMVGILLNMSKSRT